MKKKTLFRQRLDDAMAEAKYQIRKKIHESPNSIKIETEYEGKLSRPLAFSEIHLILTRFQIMEDEEPNKYSIAEFIQQEDFRRDIFNIK